MVAVIAQGRCLLGSLAFAYLCVFGCALGGCAAPSSSDGLGRATEAVEMQPVACVECERTFGIDAQGLWLQRPGQAPQQLIVAASTSTRANAGRDGDAGNDGETVWLWRARTTDADGLLVREFRACVGSARDATRVLRRRFIVEGLRADWSVVVRVPLIRADGSAINLLVHGAPVTRSDELVEIELPLARDEATRLEYR